MIFWILILSGESVTNIQKILIFFKKYNILETLFVLIEKRMKIFWKGVFFMSLIKQNNGLFCYIKLNTLLQCVIRICVLIKISKIYIFMYKNNLNKRTESVVVNSQNIINIIIYIHAYKYS